MLDNFDIIKPLLTFENENDFYFLQILQRKKDHPEGTVVGSNNSSRLIKSYNIFSISQLDKYKKEIIMLCELFEARAGINLNKRNSKVLALKMISDIATYLECNHTNSIGSLWNEVCGKHQHSADRRWIIDIDREDSESDNEFDSHISNISGFICNCQPIGNDKIITNIPSKSGVHLITKPFNTREFKDQYPEIDIHKNNPTNLYIP
jgi:hypothetical protein